MAFLKFIFYVILYILIKIGDVIYLFLTHFVNVLSFPFRITFYFFKKNIVEKYKKNKIGKKRYEERTNTISYNASKEAPPLAVGIYKKNNLLQLFFNILKNTSNLIIAFRKGLAVVVLKILAEIIGFLLFVYSLFTLPIRYVAKFVKNKRKKRGLESRKTVLVNKTTFSYKLKYLFLGVFFAFFLFFLPATFYIFTSDLPSLSNISVSYIPKTTKIFDRNGNLLYEIYANQNRTIVSLKRIPTYLKEATVAIEDRNFYKNAGFDLRGIGRAIYVDLTKGELQGGSTITQQLIKSALLTPEPTLIRKLRELVLAFWAEQKYTKNQILELYFNYVPYGGTAWGVEAASQLYFGEDVSKLSLAQSAYLAGLPQAPSIYSPYSSDRSAGKRRQKEVLNAMVSSGYITQKQADSAFREVLIFKSPQVPILAPHFVMYVKNLLEKQYGIYEVEKGGLQVTTSLDLNIQKMAEKVVTQEVDNDQYLGIGNGAALVTNPKNGDILAMVGSKDYFDVKNDGNVNLTTALRQPGSTIKVVTYSLALSKGFSEGSILNDVPLTIVSPGGEVYSPVNYDGTFHGKVPLRIAFANSFNIPAVRVARKLGVDQIVKFGKEMGITSWGPSSKYGLSITLGAAEVSMVDLSTVYGVVANQGKRVDLNPILEVKNSEGKILEKKKVQSKRVLDPGVAFIISDILADNKARSIEFGLNSPLNIPNQRVSVKTGTTDNKRDNWTVGFTPDYVVAAWVGNNDNTPLSQALASGITGAAPIWHNIMSQLLKNKPSAPVIIPQDIVSRQCFGYTAYFLKGTQNQACVINFPSPTPTP